MKFYEIRKYLRYGGSFGKIKIKEPKVELLNPEKLVYPVEEAAEILGIDLIETQDDIVCSSEVMPYKNIISRGLEYKIWDKWLKVVKPIKGVTSKYVHFSDLKYEDYDKVLPRPNPRDPLIVLAEQYIEKLKKKKIAKRRWMLERLYWTKRFLVANGRDPDIISSDWISLTEKEKKEWLLMNLDYEQKTREEAVGEWGVGKWKWVNGKLIKRCSKTLFKPEGKVSHIRYKKLPLTGYEEYVDS